MTESGLARVRMLLDERGKTFSWLCTQCQVSRQHLREVLSGYRPLKSGLFDSLTHELGIEKMEFVLNGNSNIIANGR